MFVVLVFLHVASRASWGSAFAVLPPGHTSPGGVSSCPSLDSCCVVCFTHCASALFVGEHAAVLVGSASPRTVVALCGQLLCCVLRALRFQTVRRGHAAALVGSASPCVADLAFPCVFVAFVPSLHIGCFQPILCFRCHCLSVLLLFLDDCSSFGLHVLYRCSDSSGVLGCSSFVVISFSFRVLLLFSW